jgi:hypothetical protein
VGYVLAILNLFYSVAQNYLAFCVNYVLQGFIQNDNTGIPGGHGANLSVFDAINQRLSALGIPTWRAGPYTVRPVVSLGFLLSLLLMGFSGLLFSGVLFFISKYSQHGWSDDRITRTEDSGTRSVPPPAAGGNWPGSGHRLGR